MLDARVHIRRCRRTDFSAVMQLLNAGAVPLPVPDRGTLRRFRYLVADLGSDLYLAVTPQALAGLVHVTYARQLATAPAARLDQLVVATAFRRHGIGSALLAFARRRARQRGCAALSCTVPTAAVQARAFLTALGLQHAGERFTLELGTADREWAPDGDDA